MVVLGLALGSTVQPAHAGKPKAAPPPPAQAQPIAPTVLPPPPPEPSPRVLPAEASPEVRGVAQWIRGTRDNAGLPYVLVDKTNARVFAFDAAGQLLAHAPALLGMGRGDRMLVPNDAPMSAIPPQKRITPAGRYVSRLAIDSDGKELLVIDYDASLSLHAVIKGTPAEHRAERLASATIQDNRISFGCINVPTAFYATVVSPTFANTMGIVYILPETQAAGELFGFQPSGTPGVGSPLAPAITSGTPAGQSAAVPGAQ